MAKRPAVQWDWVQEKWESGRFSNPDIGRMHAEQFGGNIGEDAIRKRAQRHAWSRDESQVVAKQARERVVREMSGNVRLNVRPDIEANIRAEIDSAVDVAADYTRRHLDDADKIRAGATLIEMHAVAQLQLNERGEPALVHEPGELKDLATVMGKAAELRVRAIAAERDALGMDSADAGPSQVVVRFEEFGNRSTGLASSASDDRSELE